jgi:Phospholipase_D-nuclease N-terminal
VIGYYLGQLANTLPFHNGIGGVEGGMIGTFLAVGVQSHLAVLAALGYRTISHWLPTVPGAIATGAYDGNSNTRRTPPAATWIWVAVSVVRDVYRSRDLSPGAKAGWIFVVVLIPLLGVMLYVIARGDKMSEHEIGGERQLEDLRSRGVLT